MLIRNRDGRFSWLESPDLANNIDQRMGLKRIDVDRVGCDEFCGTDKPFDQLGDNLT